jgi:AcrR family transcriptional regulator
MSHAIESANGLAESLRERHKHARRCAIVRAARELLREGAAAGLTKEAIAARANVSPATVYNLVGTRAQLFSALAELFVEEVSRRLAERPPRDALRRARRVIDVTCDVILEDPVVHAALVRGWYESGLGLGQGSAGALIEALAEAKLEGALIVDADVRLLASSVATACIGALHQWASGTLDGRKFRARCVFALELALAAAAAPSRRTELVRALHKRRRDQRQGAMT